jgi:MFS transporter, DHA2 family, multidrug resistance protein
MQATYMGYADCFGLLGAILLCAMLAVAMLKKGSASGAGAH